MHFITHLLNFTVLTFESWQLNELNSIITAAEQSAEISTLAFFGRSKEIEPYIRSSEQKHIPKLVVTNNYGDINFQKVSGLNRNIFFVAVGSVERKPLWDHINNAFFDIQIHVRGVFMVKRSNNKYASLNLSKHFQWFWQKGFTDLLVLVDNEKDYEREFEIYSYNNFLPQKISNMTKVEKLELFRDKFRNLYKYEIRTSAEFEPPRVFERRNCQSDHKPRLLGYVASLFQAFIKQYNAGINMLYYSTNRSYNILDVIQRINNDEIDLSINTYIPSNGVHLSYPIRMLQRCVVVPYPEELSKYSYFIMPFERKVWLVFLASWFILSLSYIFGWFFTQRSCKCKQPDVGQIFLNVWRLLISLPIPTACCNKHFKWFYAAWFAHIAALGFILANLYMASLTSFFSGLTFKPLITTLDELVQHHIKIDTIDYEIPVILDNRGLPKGFADLLNPRNSSALVTDMLSLKPQQSFAALEDRISFTLSQQIHLMQPISHSVEECITTVPLGFLMPAHSQFELPINRFILSAASAGLIDKWFLESIQDGYCSGILEMRKSDFEIARPMTLEHFQFGWYVLFGGYCAGWLIFLMENLRRLRKRFKVFIVYC